jgi:hypothetical protein
MNMYVPTIWSEYEMSEAEKIIALNNLETQADEIATYAASFEHENFYTKAEATARYFRTASHPSGRTDTGAGCGIDAALLDGQTLAQILQKIMPLKAIGMFAGATPARFMECDGSNGTRDLREKYLRGAGGSIANGDTGGSNSLIPTCPNFDSLETTLTSAQIPSHTHSYVDRSANSASAGTGDGGYQRSSTYRTAATTDTNGGTTTTPHKHSGCSFAWTGYKDEGGITRTGAFDKRPPSRAVKFITRSI